MSEIVEVVLDLEELDDSDRILIQGVFRPWQPHPPLKPGRTRNVMHVFLGVGMHDVSAFRIGRVTTVGGQEEHSNKEKT